MSTTEYATIHKTKIAGWVVKIIGVEVTAEGHRDDAQAFADKVNARCNGLSPEEVRGLYKLGDQFPRAA